MNLSRLSNLWKELKEKIMKTDLAEAQKQAKEYLASWRSTLSSFVAEGKDYEKAAKEISERREAAVRELQLGIEVHQRALDAIKEANLTDLVKLKEKIEAIARDEQELLQQQREIRVPMKQALEAALSTSGVFAAFSEETESEA